MKKFYLSIAMIVLVSLSGSAFGFAFNNQALTDKFGDNPFDAHNNCAPIDYPHGVGYLPSPGALGEGGERYDLEGFLVTHDQDFMYIAVTNSFGESAYSPYWNRNYRMGDIFFGFNNDNLNKNYGINFMTGQLYEIGSGGYNYIDNHQSTYYSYTDIRNRVGAYTINNLATNTGAMAQRTGGLTDLVEESPIYNFETEVYTYEFKIAMTDLQALAGWQDDSNLFFHTTLGCGNDLMETTYNTAIPEPATMILFGLGLCGAGIIRRRMNR
ncbi:MAG: PEP-CTERM sorting domain-containing protein [Candidatus Zixiibacteriota bacterium]